METICLQCGDVGFTNAFVYCVRCLNFAVHRYCLDVIPDTLDEFVCWLCDDCGGTVQKRSPINEHNVKVISAVETMEKDQVVAKENGCKNTLDECGISFQQVEAEKAQDCGLQDECFPDNISLKEMVKGKKRKNATSQDIPLKENVHRKKKNRAHADNKSSMQSHEECTKVIADLLTDSNLRARRNLEKVNELRIKRSAVRKPSDPGKTEKPNGSLKKSRNKNGTQEKKCSISSAQSRPEDRNIFNKESDNTEDKTRNSSKDDLRYSQNPYAEPVISPIWRGSFYIRNQSKTLKGLVAHISRKACQKVFNAASQFQTVLCLEKLPRSQVWPKSFESSVPTNSSIALYFFPTKISVSQFDHLVQEMMDKDLALKCIVQNAELLIFTSTELPLLYWRFQGKHYLWGVFREKGAHSKC